MTTQTDLYLWAGRHGVGAAALTDLLRLMSVLPPEATPVTPMAGARTSEAYVQSTVRLEAASKGMRLWRNNVGVLEDRHGRPVRFGLANDSAELNKTLKSSDLVGWRPIVVEPYMVGRVVAQVVVRECKAADWHWTGTDREVAQLRFINLVLADGGDAAFTTGPGTL